MHVSLIMAVLVRVCPVFLIFIDSVPINSYRVFSSLPQKKHYVQLAVTPRYNIHQEYNSNNVLQQAQPGWVLNTTPQSKPTVQ